MAVTLGGISIDSSELDQKAASPMAVIPSGTLKLLIPRTSENARLPISVTAKVSPSRVTEVGTVFSDA